MKVFACIPSYNEQATIRDVVETVDRGLCELRAERHEPIETRIVNVDSASEDDTVDIFEKTDTHTRKQSITCDDVRGKGTNLFRFLELCQEEEVAAAITIDADIRSVSPMWVKKLVTPILDDRADFITPLYERSRFEGSTTNHLAYPITLAATGLHVRQPIAGDFAFRPLSLPFLHTMEVPSAVYRYGIDIFLTLTALRNGLRHYQVLLGEKQHNPSFHKLEYMFPQVAAAAGHVLRNMNGNTKNHYPTPPDFSGNISPSARFPHKRAAHKMQSQARNKLQQIQSEGQLEWLPPSILNDILAQEKGNLESEQWVQILASWVTSVQNRSKPRIDIEQHANELLPFFVLRATSFWLAAEKMSKYETEHKVREQAHSFCERINQKKA